MKFKDGKTFSAYVRAKLHSGYKTLLNVYKISVRLLTTLVQELNE